MEEESQDTWVILDVRQQLYREVLKRIIDQQADMAVTPFEPDGTEASLWRCVKHELETHPENQLVVVSLFDESDADGFWESCVRLLAEFPALMIAAINYQSQEFIALRNEVRCDRIPSSLPAMMTAIRNQSRSEYGTSTKLDESGRVGDVDKNVTEHRVTALRYDFATPREVLRQIPARYLNADVSYRPLIRWLAPALVSEVVGISFDEFDKLFQRTFPVEDQDRELYERESRQLLQKAAEFSRRLSSGTGVTASSLSRDGGRSR